METRDWSALHDNVMDGVVSSVKKAGRWRRDGPSLRAVDRRWCRCVSGNVTETRPHFSRQLSPDSAHSLRKFPRVTTVDVGGFSIREATSESCKTLLDALNALPALSRLELSVSPDACPFLGSSQLAALSRVTSLKFGNRQCMRPVAMLGMLRRLPLREIVIDSWIQNLGAILAEAPALRKLCIGGNHDLLSDISVSRLQGLESLSLDHTLLSPAQLLTLPSLQHVGVRIQESDLSTVGQLTQVTSLILRFGPSEGNEVHLDGLARLTTLRSLEVVSLAGDHLLLRLDTPLQYLERLCATLFVLTGSEVRDYLSNIKILCLEHCEISRVEDFPTAFPNLERLSFVDVVEDNGSDLVWEWTPVNFPKLTVVSVTVNDRCSLEELDSLTSMTRLERLDLNYYALDPDLTVRLFRGLEKLIQLPSLRELAIGEFRRICDLDAFLAIEALTQLEVLAISLDGLTTDWSSVLELRRHEGLRTLLEKAPLLRLSSRRDDLMQTVKQWTVL